MTPLTLIALPVVGLLLMFTMPVTMTEEEEIGIFMEEYSKFAVELFQATRKPNENVVISPIILQVTLALTYIGAKGNTKIQIGKALHLPNDIEAVVEELKQLIEYLEDPVLDINYVATMFIEKTLKMKTRFLERVEKYFQPNVGFAKFKEDPRGTGEEINQWVEQRSHDKFINFLDEGAINSNTRLFHVNAFFFKKEWETRFDKLPDSDFHVSPNNKVKVTMLYQNELFPYKYLPELKAKIVELPHYNRDFKMVIILPDEINGLSEIENKLSTLNIPQIVASLDEVFIDIKLPSFRIDKTIDMMQSLKKLGINDLCDSNKGNMNGIAKHLYLPTLNQKVFFEVSENKKAPLYIPQYSGDTQQREYFIADHPFMFFIYYNKVPLIIGSINSL